MGLGKPTMFLWVKYYYQKLNKVLTKHFAGHDASRCFITGKFAPEDISDDVTGLSSEELLSLKNWLDFYRKEYIEIGMC